MLCSEWCRLCCVVCSVCCLLCSLLRLGYALHVVLYAEEVAELEKRNEQLVADNAALDKENDEYSGALFICYVSVHCAVGDAVSGLLHSEELADMKLKMAEMEAELKRNCSVPPELQCMSVHVLVYI